jgi:thymidylate synthase
MARFNPPSYEECYLHQLQLLVDQMMATGVESDRTGTGTARLFGAQLRCDLRTDFPLLTTKKVFTRGIIEELLWFLRGETNNNTLKEKSVNIWNEFAAQDGELGPIYGAQWKNWGGIGIDQIAGLIDQLRTNPESRRMIVSAWNPDVLPVSSLSPSQNAAAGNQALPPCHTLFQCFAQKMSHGERLHWALEKLGEDVHEEAKAPSPGRDTFLDECYVPRYYLDLQLYQRSADWFLGVPFNAVSYALLLKMLAYHVNMEPRHFIHTFGDLHLYSNHVEQALEQLRREIVPQKPNIALIYEPTLALDQVMADFFEVQRYHPQPAIKAPVSV